MPAWEQRKLSELADIHDSARIPNNEWSESGIPYIRASDISDGSIEGALFLRSETYEKYRNKTGVPKRGDVLFNGGGEIGKSLYFATDFPVYVQGGAVLYAETSTSDELEGEYLHTFFSTQDALDYIDQASAGGTMKHFTLIPAKMMPIAVPELDEQRQIGAFFSELDALITLHQREPPRMMKEGKNANQYQ